MKIAWRFLSKSFGLSGTDDPATLVFGFDGYAHPAAAFRHDVLTGRTDPLGAPARSIDA